MYTPRCTTGKLQRSEILDAQMGPLNRSPIFSAPSVPSKKFSVSSRIQNGFRGVSQLRIDESRIQRVKRTPVAPADDSEFRRDGTAIDTSAAAFNIDLLTVIPHELGHFIGPFYELVGNLWNR